MLTLLTAVLCCASTPPLAAEPNAPGKLIDAIVYATRGDSKVHILDAATFKPLTSIDVGVGAHETAISPDGRWLLGSAYGGPGPNHQPADNRVIIVDLAAGKLHKTVTLAGMQRPNDIAFRAGTGEAVITVEMPPQLVVLTPETGEYRTIPIDKPAGHMLALHPKGDTAYVAHVAPGSLSVIDLVKDKVTASIALPPGAEGLAITPDGSRVFVASHQGRTVSIIDTAKNVVADSFERTGFPFRVRASPGGDLIAMSLPAGRAVALVNAADTKVQHVVDLRLDDPAIQVVPTALAFLPAADNKAPSRIAVLCEGQQPEIVIINLADRTIASRVAITGPIPDALTAGRVSGKKIG